MDLVRPALRAAWRHLVREPWAKKDDRRGVLHADKPEHLAEYIADAEAARNGEKALTVR